MENNQIIKTKNIKSNDNKIIKEKCIKYIKSDDNKIINEKCIKWVKKMDDCLEVCTKSTGCNIKNGDTHQICKIYNLDSYNKLNKYFS
jgi:hypothetical protein